MTFRFRPSVRSIQVSPSVMRREFPVDDPVSERNDLLKERRPKETKKSENSFLDGDEGKTYYRNSTFDVFDVDHLCISFCWYFIENDVENEAATHCKLFS